MGVLAQRDFRLVYGASLVSLLGDGVKPLALTFAVLDLTGSATDLGVVLGTSTLGLVGSLLVGGVVADRVSRRTVMIAADLVRLLAQGAIGVLLVAGHATVAELAATQGLVGAASGFFNPASSGLIPLVAGDRLREANSLRGIANAAGSIAGPVIAGVLVAATNPGIALLVDAGSYGASGLLLARVRRDVRTATAAGAAPRFLTELRHGFAQVRARTWLWTTLMALSLVNAVTVAFVVLGAVVVKRHLGGPGAWAAILAAQGVGALLGATTLLRLAPRRPLLVATLIGMIPVVPTFLLAIPAPLVLIVIAAFLGGAGEMVFNTLWETTLQQHVPEAARSRVSSYDWFGSLALRTIGFAVIGPVAAGLGTSPALYLCGSLELVAVASLLTVRDIRTLTPRPITGSPVGPADTLRQAPR